MRHTVRMRITGLFFGFCGLYLVLLGNLFMIQYVHTDFFYTLAQQQYHHTVTQLPARASILDRFGTPMAMNKDAVAAFIMPNKLTQPHRVHHFLKTHFPHAYTRLCKKKDSSFMYIKRRLSSEEQEMIRQANLNDLHFLQESSRFYAIPSASPLIGFTDIDNHGVAGIERYCQSTLAGNPARYVLEKDARSRCFYFKKQLFDSGSSGKEVRLTVDSGLQFLVDEEVAAARERFNARELCAIIMDPQSGDILAISSHPYAHCDGSQPLCIADAKQRVVADAYELGSVMKVFCALAALEEGVVSSDEIIDCKNKRTCFIDGRKINTVKAHGALSFCDVVAYSNNIGIAQVAKRLNDRLYDHYVRIGFGAKTGIALPAEQSGYINHPDNWSKQSIISLSYGYEITATVLQLAAAFCMLARDGEKVVPRILYTEDAPLAQKIYSTQAVRDVKEMLQKGAEYGTSWRTRIKGYDIMAKTGTANQLINGVYDDRKHLYTCAAIIEKDSYQRVIVTFVKDASIPNPFAATVAAPVLRALAEKMIIHERAV